MERAQLTEVIHLQFQSVKMHVLQVAELYTYE